MEGERRGRNASGRDEQEGRTCGTKKVWFDRMEGRVDRDAGHEGGVGWEERGLVGEVKELGRGGWGLKT